MVYKVCNDLKGLQADFSISKLKQGVGEHVVNILDFLANAAINKQHILMEK